MLFPTIDFAIFFVVVLTVYWLLRPYPIAWRVFLIGASYFFYGYWDVRFCLLLAGSTLGNWLFGRWVFAAMRNGARTKLSRWLVAADVVANLAVLGWFKYYGFFSTEVKNGLGDIGINLPLPLLHIALPIGISFFTFQGISYVIDIHRGQIKSPMGFLDFTVFQSFFAHLIAGVPHVTKPDALAELANVVRAHLRARATLRSPVCRRVR